MKENKPENQKKESRKAAKKALEQSLTSKLFEAVKSLGHDAEKIGEDLVLVSKFVAKKISKKVKGDKKESKVAVTPAAEKTTSTKAKATITKAQNPIASKPEKTGKKDEVKKKATSDAKPVTKSVKVDVIPFNEVQKDQPKVEPVKAKGSNPVVKSNKPVKTAVKKGKPASSTDKEQLN